MDSDVLESMKTVYLSGKMAGIPDLNRDSFKEAREILRSRGYIVVCPHENSQDHLDQSRAFHMRRDIEHVLEVDGLFVLPGYRMSRGACLEIAVALEIGIPVREFGTDKPITSVIVPIIVAEDPGGKAR